MDTWKPISEEDFKIFFKEQYRELDAYERQVFERYKVDFWKAIITRSKMAGDEYVYVVAQNQDGILYFDDVEYGFNIATVDDTGRVLTPGGSQFTLKEAVAVWLIG